MKLGVKELDYIKGLSNEDRFNYLRGVEKSLIKIKKSADISSDEFIAPVRIETQIIPSVKSKQFVAPEQDSIHVKVVANTANWIDSQMDMILPGAWNKSISERKGLIPFLHDHLRSLDARIADVTDIYEGQLPLKQLGIDKEGIGFALIFEADVKAKYNQNIFEQYKNGQVNQHSIGLRYIDLTLALNDPNDEKHFNEWQKYINDAINPEIAIEMGYMWIVKELKLIENSAVLFGANEITPTLETRSYDETQSQQEAEQSPQDIEPIKESLEFTELLKDFKL